MKMACSLDQGNMLCIQGFGWKPLCKEIICETVAYLEE